MSYFYEPEIPQFEPLAENGENYATWRQTMLTTLDILDLGHFVATGMEGTAREDVLARREVRSHLTPALIAYAIDFPTTRDLWTALATRFVTSAPTAQPHDLPRHKATKDAKEGGDGHGGQGEGRGNGRGRRRGRKPAVRSEDTTRATNDRPGSRVKPSTIVHRHNEREDTHAYNATIPLPQDSKTAPQGDLDTPGATQIVHHNREDAYERSVAAPEALDVYNESKAIERRVDTQATTYASNATQESNPDAPGDEATPDNAPTQLDASDVFSSHRIAKLRDPEPTTLDNAGPDPFRVGEGDIRRKSTSRDGAFDEEETPCQGVEPNRSQQPVDEDVASIGRNGDKATKLDVPSRLEPPARSAEAGEASEAFERRNNASSPPIRAPEAPEPSQAWQTMPNPPDRPLPTVHAPEPGDDPPGVVYDTINTPTPFLGVHNAQHAPQGTPERTHVIPPTRTRTPTVFDDGGEVCLRRKVIEDQGVPGVGGVVYAAQRRMRPDGQSTTPTASYEGVSRQRRSVWRVQTRTTRLRKPQRRTRLARRIVTRWATNERVMPQSRRIAAYEPERHARRPNRTEHVPQGCQWC